MTIRFFTLCSSLALLVPPLEARPAGNDPLPVTPEEVVTSAGVEWGAPQRGILATTVPGGLPDVFGLTDGQFFRCHQPGIFDSTRWLAGGITDLTCAAGLGQGPETDGVITLGDEGVRLWTADPQTGQMSWTSVDSTYQGGVQVLCADVYGDGAKEVVVLEDNREALRIYRKSPDWKHAHTLSLTGLQILDFALPRLDSAGGADLALAVHNGTRSFRLHLPPEGSDEFTMTPDFYRISWAYTQSQVALLRDHVDVGIDGYAWTCYVEPLDQWALSAGYGGSIGDQPAYLFDSDRTVLGLASGRIDYQPTLGPGSSGPQRDDVAISFVESEDLFFFINRGPWASKAFDSLPDGEAQLSGFIKSPTGNNVLGAPVVGDLDGNLTGELLLGLDAASTSSSTAQWLVYDVTPETTYTPEEGGGDGSPPQRPIFRFDLDPWDPNQPSVYADGWRVDESVPGTEFEAAFETNEGLLGIELSLWLQASSGLPFEAMGTASCQTTYDGVPPIGLQQLTAGILQPALAGQSQYATFFDSMGRYVAMLARPAHRLSDGSRPAIWLVHQGVDELEGTAPWEDNAYVEFPTGVLPSRLARIPPPESGSSNDDGSTRGVGIVVESLPPRRISPPPGGPPPQGGPSSCPPSSGS